MLNGSTPGVPVEVEHLAVLSTVVHRPASISVGMSLLDFSLFPFSLLPSPLFPFSLGARRAPSAAGQVGVRQHQLADLPVQLVTRSDELTEGAPRRREG